MECMFYKCSSLISLDLSSFETENVISISYMFNSCTSLSELNLSNFNTKNCFRFTSMFTGTKKIKVTINKDNNPILVENNKDKLDLSDEKI